LCPFSTRLTHRPQAPRSCWLYLCKLFHLDSAAPPPYDRLRGNNRMPVPWAPEPAPPTSLRGPPVVCRQRPRTDKSLMASDSGTYPSERGPVMSRTLRVLATVVLSGALVWAAPAMGTTWQNGDVITSPQLDWGGSPLSSTAAALLAANFNSFYPGGFEVGLLGNAGFSMLFGDATSLL